MTIDIRSQHLVLLPSGHDSTTTIYSSISLPHPASGSPNPFLIVNNHPSLLIYLKHVHNEQSVFINNSVSKDGSILIGTLFDPTFLLLRVFAQDDPNLARSLNDLPHYDEFPDLNKYLAQNHDYLNTLLADHLCTIISVLDYNVFRLDPAKIKSWLKLKLDVLVSNSYDLQAAFLQLCTWLPMDIAFVRLIAESVALSLNVSVDKPLIAAADPLDMIALKSASNMSVDVPVAETRQPTRTRSSKKLVPPINQRSVASFFTRKSA